MSSRPFGPGVPTARDDIAFDIARLNHLQGGGGPRGGPRSDLPNTLGMDSGHRLLIWQMEQMGLTKLEDKLWACLVYMASRRPTTAQIQLQAWPSPAFVVDALHATSMTLFSHPASFERRGLRAPASMRRHYASLIEQWSAHNNSLTEWLTADLSPATQLSWVARTNAMEANWIRLTETVQSVFGNGRWAAFNTVELLMNVCDLPVRCGAIDFVGCTGPRAGLAMLYTPWLGNSPATVAALDQQIEDFQSELARTYRQALPLNEVETLLCEYHSMCGGLHYVGHFPDELLQHLGQARERLDREALAGAPTSQVKRDREALALVFAARKACLPHRYLGELHGGQPNSTMQAWYGIDKSRLRRYPLTGNIPDRE